MGFIRQYHRNIFIIIIKLYILFIYEILKMSAKKLKTKKRNKFNDRIHGYVNLFGNTIVYINCQITMDPLNATRSYTKLVPTLLNL